MMQKMVKNENGSISLFVLLSALFFLVVVTSVGVSFKNKEASIDAQFEKTKSSYEKDVGNEEQVYEETFVPRAIFKTGTQVNAKMKQLAGTEGATYNTEDTNIKEIKRATEISAENKIDSNIVSTPESNMPIYMWFDNTNGTIYWYTKDEEPESNPNSSYMFYKCVKCTNIDVSKIDTSNVTNMGAMFSYCSELKELDVSSFDTQNVNIMTSMFNRCSQLTRLDIRNFNTSKVTKMSSMFMHCYGLLSLNLKSFNTSNVTDMTSMFEECTSLISLNITSFDTSKVTTMAYMFDNCNSLTVLDVSRFNTSNATNMISMFNRCKKLTSINVSNFNTSKVTNMSGMFYYCTGLTSLDVSSFDTSKVTNMQHMFRGTNLTNLDLSNFDTSNAIYMYYMFAQCNNLSTIYASDRFVVDKFEKGIDSHGNDINSTDMFEGCINLVGGSGTTYSSSKKNKTYAHIDEGQSNPGYFTAKT
ncbi:MAG: BspA family leucine-rich repeat surface protein [Clostridia bacterium]|nr:BspA family leucine-rich repeat surface protein [Clostridia bacterium]